MTLVLFTIALHCCTAATAAPGSSAFTPLTSSIPLPAVHNKRPRKATGSRHCAYHRQLVEKWQTGTQRSTQHTAPCACFSLTSSPYHTTSKYLWKVVTDSSQCLHAPDARPNRPHPEKKKSQTQTFSIVQGAKCANKSRDSPALSKSGQTRRCPLPPPAASSNSASEHGAGRAT